MRARILVFFALFLSGILFAVLILRAHRSYSPPWKLDEKQQKRNPEESQLPHDPNRDIPFDPDPLERLESNGLGANTKVNCWPSVGGMIIGSDLSSVELDFLDLPRFESVPRTYNTTEEDEFCRKLRKVGGKWWSSYGDYEMAVEGKNRPTTSLEKEGLLLGWPITGGVWV